MEIELLKRRVDELQEAEERRKREVEESPATIEALMDYIPEAITIISAHEQKIRMASREALRILGAEREGIEGMTLAERAERWAVYAPDGHRLANEELPLTIALNEGRTIKDQEMVLVRPDGQTICLLANAGPIFDHAGKLLGSISAWRDITARKKAETALKESERMLAEAQRMTHVGNWIWDLEKDLFCGSDEAYVIFGRPAGTPIKYDEFIGTVVQEDQESIQSAIARALEGEPYKAEYRIAVQDRLKHILALGSTEFRDGRPVSMRGTVQDVTERKEREEQLMEALAKIKTLSGLIPICANCKRIRDDRGYWMRIEKYIEERSMAEFTHSLCPECEEKLYGKEKEQ
ncbi:MAG: hypothetical protein A2V21_301965 [Deltaproteobacteria bacterium GWC2_55_46]|nr:MAG: hypothetical protein A2Z79_06700 [Deltaproteobacteria bacterium GWA2_55_82]OGQ63298.1 MAG: hypothetical protein A3I81_00900 [Deltaproteobacteria bacterium RIFCSPLOWO2_02_FULL_55_12]OIJ73134.1 MAG: hypothetical protein A2V21_301965 [Deltaproteobacteria bacterium GWC2_55_46]